MKTPLIIAHRGARRIAPENTIPAFEKALEYRADGIEFDVMMTADGKLVVTHNDDLQKLTGFEGHIHNTPFDTIRSLDAGSHFSSAYGGTRIPTLEEVLELISKQKILTIVELKKQPNIKSEFVKRVKETLARFDIQGNIVISSADISLLIELKKQMLYSDRAAVIAFSAFPFFTPLAYGKLLSVSALHVLVSVMSQRLIRQTRKMGMELFAWTINTSYDVERCLDAKADGMITDDILFVKGFLETRGPANRQTGR